MKGHDVAERSKGADFSFRLEPHGGQIDCQMSRDFFLYASSIERNGMDTVMEIIADTVLRPNFTPETMEFGKMSVQFQNEDIEVR